MLFFDSRVEVFGYRLAAEAADHRSDGCPDNGAYWTSSNGACRGPSSETACRCAYAYTHRVRARRAADRVAVQRRLHCVVIHGCLQLYRENTVRRE